jgi:hypothetical protein
MLQKKIILSWYLRLQLWLWNGTWRNPEVNTVCYPNASWIPIGITISTWKFGFFFFSNLKVLKTKKLHTRWHLSLPCFRNYFSVRKHKASIRCVKSRAWYCGLKRGGLKSENYPWIEVAKDKNSLPLLSVLPTYITVQKMFTSGNQGWRKSSFVEMYVEPLRPYSVIYGFHRCSCRNNVRNAGTASFRRYCRLTRLDTAQTTRRNSHKINQLE